MPAPMATSWDEGDELFAVAQVVLVIDEEFEQVAGDEEFELVVLAIDEEFEYPARAATPGITAPFSIVKGSPTWQPLSTTDPQQYLAFVVS
ncbi:hypothetical protein CNMCM5793_005479 [Aspergillus hiratsukae]|uniref:Uncharacterized protein n=1 Tax=Aspergillus hiratsukae TaxID=1194566 RepID=A0A8H6PGF9_9EURO|nr:hypothetical protein CNMCM5793_005479 [Aspergillus hiratsukae]KAF7171529.1 hypothetical protein CNMCM6106_005891 [Aspergillus hiratsukae]